MENLYQTLQDKKKSVKSFKDDTTKGDYYFYFLEEFMPELINNIIDKLKLKDMAEIDSLNDIKRKYTVHFFRRYRNEPVIKIDDDGEAIYIHLSNDNSDELREKIVSFFAKWEMIKDNVIHDDKMIIEFSLEKIITTYGLELSQCGRPEEGLEMVEDLIAKAGDKTSSFDSILADEVHAKAFEQEFLDTVVVQIIKNKIACLNQRNFKKGNERKVLVHQEIVICKEDYGDNIIIADEEIDDMLKMLKSFMSDYNLGFTRYLHSPGIVVHFNTNLADLMDAYYMEKQRIEHYTSGDYLIKEAEPTVKRITPINR